MKNTILRPDVFKFGMIAGTLITVVMMITRAIEVTPMNFELSLGAVLTTQVDALAWLVGFGMHLMISGLIAFAYAAAFRATGRAGWGIGLEFGIVHWLASGILMNFIPRLYSLVPGIMEPPGFFGFNLGAVNFLGNLVSHLVFGIAMGGLCARAANIAMPRREQAAPSLVEKAPTPPSIRPAA